MDIFKCLKKFKLVDLEKCKECFDNKKSGYNDLNMCRKLNLECYDENEE